MIREWILGVSEWGFFFHTLGNWGIYIPGVQGLLFSFYSILSKFFFFAFRYSVFSFSDFRISLPLLLLFCSWAEITGLYDFIRGLFFCIVWATTTRVCRDSGFREFQHTGLGNRTNRAHKMNRSIDLDLITTLAYICIRSLRTRTCRRLDTRGNGTCPSPPQRDVRATRQEPICCRTSLDRSTWGDGGYGLSLLSQSALCKMEVSLFFGTFITCIWGPHAHRFR